MSSYVVGLEAVDRTQRVLAGGKGANLGELSRIPGIRVPPGFCVTTQAYARVLAVAPRMDALLGTLSDLKLEDREGIRALSADIRRTLEEVPVPDDVTAAIGGALARLGAHAARPRPLTRGMGGGARGAGGPRRPRRPLQRDGGGHGGGLLRRPAGHVPQRR